MNPESHVFTEPLSFSGRHGNVYALRVYYGTMAIDIQNRHLGAAAVVIWKQLSRLPLSFSLSRFAFNSNTMAATHHFVP